MEIIKGKIEYTDEEIKFFERTNPTLFDIAVMVNERLGDVFWSRHMDYPIKRGMKLWETGRLEVDSGCCAAIMLVGKYCLEDPCLGRTCSMAPCVVSCFELTWKEVRGEIPIIDRCRKTIEQRKAMMQSKKCITVV